MIKFLRRSWSSFVRIPICRKIFAIEVFLVANFGWRRIYALLTSPTEKLVETVLIVASVAIYGMLFVTRTYVASRDQISGDRSGRAYYSSVIKLWRFFAPIFAYREIQLFLIGMSMIAWLATCLVRYNAGLPVPGWLAALFSTNVTLAIVTSFRLVREWCLKNIEYHRPVTRRSHSELRTVGRININGQQTDVVRQPLEFPFDD